VLAFHAVVYLDLPLRGGLLGHTSPTFAAGAPERNAFRSRSESALETSFRQLLLPLRYGHLGVPMFFVISGFCVTFPAARLLGKGAEVRIHRWNYVKRRFWRLYPTHLVAILGSIGLVVLSHFLLRWTGRGPIERIPGSALAAHFAMLQAQL